MREQMGLLHTSVLLALLFTAAAALGLGRGQLQAQQSGRKLHFEIYQDAAQEYRWRLKATNGEILATAGQGYKSKADAQKSVERIQTEAATPKLKFETYEDNAGEYRWRCKSGNGQIVASSSQGYKAKADCQHAIDLIKKGAAAAVATEQEK
jgi:uncharacterized protein YegP (UPF0339 family)